MRGLAFFLITCAVLTAIAFVAVWLYRRPTVKRNQLRLQKQEIKNLVERQACYEDLIRAIRSHVSDYEVHESTLATLISLEIERNKDKLTKGRQ